MSVHSLDVTPKFARCGGDDTLIIFDWDDTLLCSSAINLAQWSLPQLELLERAAEHALLTAMELGETMIVTNGNASWVHDSSHRFLPGLVPLLSRLTVTSARAQYEHAYPGDPFSWKRMAFKQIMKGQRPCGANLVVLGDSPAEMEAAHSAVRAVEAPSLVKTVKFREQPSAAQLLGQLQRVSEDLAGIVREEACTSRELEPVPGPEGSGHLSFAASGWRLGGGRDWSCSQTILDALFSKDADDDIPVELPEWMVQLADHMATWRSGLALKH